MNAVTLDSALRALEYVALNRHPGAVALAKGLLAAPADAPVADREQLLGDAIRGLIRGDIKCSDDLPAEQRPVHVSARRAFGAVHELVGAKDAPVAEPVAPTDEQIADAIECEFSATGEWPEGDAAIVRAFLKHHKEV